MAPPGRRRFGALATLPTTVLALLLFSSVASAASAVLGIDLGTEYIKATLVKPGIPLEIVLARDSKRKEAVAVAFKPSAGSAAPAKSGGAGEDVEYPERLYGSDALALAVRRPDDTYLNLKQLLGMGLGNESVKEYQRRYPGLQVTAVEGKNTVGFQSPSFDKLGQPFSVEEILAMELQNVRHNAQNMAGKGYRIENAVFTIPNFFTADERRAVKLAAELAGFRVLGLVTDGLAVGIQLNTGRTLPSINEAAKDGTMGKPEHHVVFDMGAGSTTATVLKMQGRTVKDVGRFNKTIQEVIVLGNSWDRTLGGDTLNSLIVEDMIAKFTAKDSSVDVAKVKSHGRANAKLWKEAERLRQVLSANQESSAGFEGLYDDIDFRYKLSRTEYEKLAADFAARLEKPFKDALAAAKLSVADLDSVIVHGGLTRTPLFQKTLESFVPADKLKSNVNADEAAVFGAAFKGAGLSPSFRVKEIRDTDAASYPAGITYTVDGKDKSQKLFQATSPVSAAKLVTLKALDDVDFTLFQQVEGVERPVVKVSSTNLTESVKQLIEKAGCAKEDISTKISIRLDSAFGLPEIVAGTVSCETDESKDTIADKVGGLFGFGKKNKGSQEVLKDELDEEEADGSSTTESPSTSSSSTKSSASTSSSAAADKKEQVPKKRVETVYIGFKSTPAGLEVPTGDTLNAMKDRLKAFDASDKARTQRSDLLNSLEGLTYRVRDWLEDSAFTAVASASEQSTLKELSKEASEWIYGDGASATAKQLKEKLKGLNEIIDPIKKRQTEATKRPEQIKLLQDALDQTNAMLGVIQNSIDEASKKADEAAKSTLSAASESASSVASDASEAVSSATDSAASAASSVVGNSESSSTSSAADSASSVLSSYLSPYTNEDLTSITTIYDDIKAWLADKITLQDKLQPYEDPAVLSTDLEKKAKELNESIMRLVQRKIKADSAKSKKPKTSKAKTSKTKKSSKTARESATEGAGSTPAEEVTASVKVEESSASPSASSSTRDEL